MPFITIGTLTVTVYSAFFGYAYLGLGLFVGANVAVAAFFNKARKHGRADAFDDRLSFEKMESARSWWMNRATQKEEKEKSVLG